MTSQHSTPLLAQSTTNQGDITLGEYIELQEATVFPLFSICGRLHSPDGVFASGSKCSTVWRIFLYNDALLYAVGSLGMLLLEFYKGAPYIAVLLYISFILQGIIVIPLVNTTGKRMGCQITESQKTSFKTAYDVSLRYFWMASFLGLMYCGALYYLSFHHYNLPVIVYVLVILASFTALGVGWLSMWAVFLLILDSGALTLDIQGLLRAAQKCELTLAQYEAVLARKSEAERKSLTIIDAVTVVAYISIISFVASLLVAAGQPHGLLYILGQIALQFREALLILLTLPYLAAVNEANDELSSLISREPGVASNPPQFQFQSQSQVTPTSPVASIPSETGYDLADMDANLKRMVLWSASVDRPLCVYVLGRRVKRLEMKAQIASVVLLGLGSLLSFIVEGSYRT